METTNLYIIEDVLYDYTSGMAVIAAPNLERCRQIFKDEFGDANAMLEYDASIKAHCYKLLSVNNQPEGVVSYVYGGG